VRETAETEEEVEENETEVEEEDETDDEEEVAEADEGKRPQIRLIISRQIRLCKKKGMK
jgi:hypothetical protein